MTKKQQIPQQQQAAISMKIIVPMRPIPKQSPKHGPSTSHSKIGIIWLHLWRGSVTTIQYLTGTPEQARLARPRSGLDFQIHNLEAT